MLILALALTLSACVTRIGSFSVISTRSIDWSRAGEFQRDTRRLIGEDAYEIIIIIPTKNSISIEDAIDNALDQVPGAVALLNVTFSVNYYYLPFVYGKQAYIIEGSVLIDPKLAALESAPVSPYLAVYTSDGKTFQQQALSEAEYTRLTKK
jgi:hypothetical protein